MLGISEHDDRYWYKVGVVGGILQKAYLREDLQYAPQMNASTYNLENIGSGNWESLPKISLRQGVKNISLTGGQGRLKCSCTKTTCQTKQCACFKAKVKCNSRCHPKNANCCNHDMFSSDEEDDDQPNKRSRNEEEEEDD